MTTEHSYATRAAAEWALRAAGLTGIDSPATLAEGEDGSWVVSTADADAAASLDALPPFDPAADAAARLAELRRLAAAAVDVERDRRIASGFAFAGVRYQTDAESRTRIEKARASAMAAVLGGAQAGDLRWHGLSVDFFWIAESNARTTMDAPTTILFGSAVAAREGLLIVAASDLKARIAAGEAIADVGADALWPA